MKIDENDFFRQATLKISSSLDIQKATRNCMNYLQRYIPISGMHFVLYDLELNVAHIPVSIPENLPSPGTTMTFPEKYRNELKERFSEESLIRIINDLLDEPEFVQELVSLVFPPDYSLLQMQLKLDGTMMGELGIYSEGKHRYSEIHAHLISLLHEPFSIVISNILQHQEILLQHQEILRLNKILSDDNRYLQREMMHLTGDTIIGAKFGLKKVIRMVEHVAPTDSPVMIIGETGTGKEVIANAIHLSSKRKDRPFIKINCGAIPENLIDSELFGHEKGAFTGAVSTKKGRFERAHNGTVFLDEVGELPPQAQVRLLRVLQQHEIERVGGTQTIPVDVRIITATHKNLEEMVRIEQFREDLWFRLNVFPIMIPPLRRRTSDIPALVNYFLEKKSMDLKIRKLPSLSPGAIERLQAHDWPGNVRELENLVERTLILNQMMDDGSRLLFDPLPTPSMPMGNMALKKEDVGIICPLDEAMANHIQKALDQTNGRVEGKNGAASMLRINPGTLRGRMKKLKIPYGKEWSKTAIKPDNDQELNKKWDDGIKFPSTSLRNAHKLEALADKLEGFLLEKLSSGFLYDLQDKWKHVKRVDFYKSYCDYIKLHNPRYSDPLPNNTFGLKLREILGDCIKNSRGTVNVSNRQTDEVIAKIENTYLFASLDICRRKFEEHVSIKIDWPES